MFRTAPIFGKVIWERHSGPDLPTSLEFDPVNGEVDFNVAFPAASEYGIRPQQHPRGNQGGYHAYDQKWQHHPAAPPPYNPEPGIGFSYPLPPPPGRGINGSCPPDIPPPPHPVSAATVSGVHTSNPTASIITGAPGPGATSSIVSGAPGPGAAALAARAAATAAACARRFPLSTAAAAAAGDLG